MKVAFVLALAASASLVSASKKQPQPHPQSHHGYDASNPCVEIMGSTYCKQIAHNTHDLLKTFDAELHLQRPSQPKRKHSGKHRPRSFLDDEDPEDEDDDDTADADSLDDSYASGFMPTTEGFYAADEPDAISPQVPDGTLSRRGSIRPQSHKLKSDKHHAQPDESDAAFAAKKHPGQHKQRQQPASGTMPHGIFEAANLQYFQHEGQFDVDQFEHHKSSHHGHGHGHGRVDDDYLRSYERGHRKHPREGQFDAERFERHQHRHGKHSHEFDDDIDRYERRMQGHRDHSSSREARHAVNFVDAELHLSDPHASKKQHGKKHHRRALLDGEDPEADEVTDDLDDDYSRDFAAPAAPSADESELEAAPNARPAEAATHKGKKSKHAQQQDPLSLASYKNLLGPRRLDNALGQQQLVANNPLDAPEVDAPAAPAPTDA